MAENNILVEYRSKAIYEMLCNKVKQLIEDILRSQHIEYHSITDRVKDETSLERKIIKKNKYNCIDEITDIAGVRIITYYADTVDTIAKIIEEEFEVDIENTIDKRKAFDPDRFGYMSLHYVVKFKDNRLQLREYKDFKNYKIEIQIRTILQHTWAEIEHDLGYKSRVEIPRNLRRSFSSLAGLLEIADREFIGIRDDLKIYSDNIVIQLEQSPSLNNIQIDNISIEKYLNQSKVVNDLNLYIVGIKGKELVNYDDSISSIVKQLNWLGYETIKNIEDDLYKYKELIKIIANKVINYMDDGFKDEEEYLVNINDNTLSYTICLFYLGYVKIIQRQSIEDILSYLEENNIGGNEKEYDFANILLNTYKDYLLHNVNR